MSRQSGDAGVRYPASPGLIVSFTSATSGVGRTSAVTNVAWLLAAAGKRVLIADWSTESSTAHEFLAPFHVGETPFPADIVRATMSLQTAGWGEPFVHRFGEIAGAGARRYDLPAGAGSIELVSHAEAADAWYRPPEFPDDQGLVGRLRSALRAHYDFILVDGTTGPEEPGLRGLAWLSDVIVFCFKVRQRAIADAAANARQVTDHAGRSVRFVFTPTQVDDRDEGRVRRSRRVLRESFADFLDTGSLAEIPYYPDDAYDERLATLLDDPGDDQSLLRAYTRLTSAITGGAVGEPAPMPAAVRARYRRAYGVGERVEPPETIYIAYATEDRPWVDWIRAQLATAEVNLVRLPPQGTPAGRTVLTVLSQHALRPALRDRLRDLGDDGATPRGGGPEHGLEHGLGHGVGHGVAGHSSSVDMVGVRVSADLADHPLGAAPVLSLAELDEYHARRTLLSHFGLIAAPPRPGAAPPRYPIRAGGPDTISNIPIRNASFVGREDELEAIRDALTGREAPDPYVLHGRPGIGKSEIVREYAHRFELDYDVMWWISAQSRRSVRASLTALAARLAVPEADDVAAALFAMLTGDGSSGSRGRRWLLIYDNADDLAVLDDLIPASGAGHVVVTSRAESATTRIRPSTAGVDAFEMDESVELLRRHTPQISVDDARAVAEAVEHLPFSLRLAGAWLYETADRLRAHGSTKWEALTWSAAEYTARLDHYRADRSPAAGPAPDTAAYSVTAAGCLAITISSLRDDRLGRLTIRLVELCSFLSPQGAARWLLCSRPTIEELVIAAGDDGTLIHKDGLVLHQVFWTAARFGLVEVDWGRQAALRMHRMLQTMVRDHMGAETRAARQAEVLRALAANVPTDADNSVGHHREVFAELQKHLAPSGALDTDDPHVRHWVVNQIRYLYVVGDETAWREALESSAGLVARWSRRFGLDDELCMMLVAQMANLHRALDNAEEALRLDEELLSRQRRSLGHRHPRTLRTGRGRGADLRAMGRFSEALAEDQATWMGFRGAFGDDHPETLMAANSLARSTFLTGDHSSALAFQRDAHDRHVRLFGPDDPVSLWYAGNLASYLRELGDYAASRGLLTETLQRIRHRHPDRVRDWLRTTKKLAVTERRLGRPESAQEHSAMAQRGYRQALGDDHSDTLASGLCLAADLDALGDGAKAVRQAEHCLAGYIRLLGEHHPFTQVCRVNIGAFLVGAGEARRAREMTRRGLEGLRETLGEQHPWTLAAAIDHACAVAADGDHGEALRLDVATAAGCEEFLDARHPYTKIVTANLRGARRAAGAGAAAGADTGGHDAAGATSVTGVDIARVDPVDVDPAPDASPFQRQRVDIDMPNT